MAELSDSSSDAVVIGPRDDKNEQEVRGLLNASGRHLEHGALSASNDEERLAGLGYKQGSSETYLAQKTGTDASG